MLKIKKDYILRVVFILVGFVLLANNVLCSDSNETLRIPLTSNVEDNRLKIRRLLRSYLEKCVFESETEMILKGNYMPGQSDVKIRFIRDLALFMPEKKGKIAYRGIRSTVSDLEEFISEGMPVKKFNSRIAITFFPEKAIDYAFYPDTRDPSRIEEDFLVVVFKIDATKIAYFTENNPEDVVYSAIEYLFTDEDILPEYIVGVYVYDKRKGQFKDITSLIKKAFLGEREQLKRAIDANKEPRSNL